ncbi:MAG: hypothetical protein KAT79_07770 [candidate division Zixibacteria bacterium]|nr:hypothetical protein [candidate division Zixibacteria bacterium]
MSKERSKLSLPKLSWQRSVCEVCGKAFDYPGKRKPHTCNSGECRHKYHYKIDPTTWASYAPTLFDVTTSVE